MPEYHVTLCGPKGGLRRVPVFAPSSQDAERMVKHTSNETVHDISRGKKVEDEDRVVQHF